MQSRSLVDAKAHLSELIDAAEHRGARTLILRHGKAAAAIVPVDVAAPRRRRRRVLSATEACRSLETFLAEFGAASPEESAVDDLLKNRR